MHKSKLLVCVDNTEHSRIAVRFACVRAKSLKYGLELIHVINPADYTSLFVSGDKIRAEKRAEAEVVLNKLVDEAKSFAGITPKVLIREGLVSEEVIKAVEEDGGINFLIIGKAPHEAGKKDMITMLSTELVSKIMIPMVIVPGNLTDLQIEELA